jgi:hypothetical protein
MLSCQKSDRSVSIEMTAIATIDGAERAYPKLINFNKLPKSGHFAASQQPGFFVSELRAAFKSLREAL